MTTRHLHLALQPLIPSRTPDEYAIELRHGFDLRLADGPLLTPTDPLLRAFGVTIAELDEVDENDEMVQNAGLNPGQKLSLVAEPDDDGREVVAVWDAECVWRAGTLPARTSAIAAAAIEFGLSHTALALSEKRTYPDGRRAGLTLLLWSEEFADLDLTAAASYLPPTLITRRRVVLLADGSSRLRWWDVTPSGGPAETSDLPVSPLLREEITRLGERLEKLHTREATASGYEAYELEVEGERLDHLARALWHRARIELAKDHAVGFIGRGMVRPVWSPGELDQGEDSFDEMSM